MSAARTRSAHSVCALRGAPSSCASLTLRSECMRHLALDGPFHAWRCAGRHYYHGTDALIFIVDANDHDRLKEARDELHKMLADEDMTNPVVLVFANKMDLPGARSASVVSDTLALNSLKETWYIQPSSAARGDGLAQGLDWLSVQIKLRPVKKHGAGS